jgi:hypothetical protein
MHFVCRDIDPENIEKLMTHKKHSARKKIIKQYLFQCYRNKYTNITDKKELMMVKNSYNFVKLVCPISLIISYMSYRVFFTGIYEIRSFYLNTARIPKFIKLGVSLGIGFYVFDLLYSDYIYHEDFYQYAINKIKDNNKF